MVSFSNDADILKYEPILFGELHFPWQVLASGTDGTLSGTTFTSTGVDFITAQVTAGDVIYLQSENGSLDGAYEIISVDSATQLTVSVLRADSQAAAVAPCGGSDISWRISTFAPQANEVGFRLMEYFDLSPGNPASDLDVEDIFDASVLRQTSVFAIIACVYATLASRTEDENLWKKSIHYHHLSIKAKLRCRLSIDEDDDGVAELTRDGSSGRLVRD